MEETTIPQSDVRHSAECGSRLRVVFENERLVSGIAGRVHVSVVRNAIEPPDVTLGDSFRASCTQEIGRPTAVLIVAREGLEIPMRDEVLARAIETARAHGPDVVAVAVVIGGAGFWASTARSAINTVAVVARKSYPTRFFARTADACKFLLSALGDVSPAADVLASDVDAFL